MLGVVIYLAHEKWPYPAQPLPPQMPSPKAPGEGDLPHSETVLPAYDWKLKTVLHLFSCAADNNKLASWKNPVKQ